MQLNIDRTVESKLLGMGGSQKVFILTSNGGNRYSTGISGVMIGSRFKIVAKGAADPYYSVKLITNGGLEFYTSSYDMMFLRGTLKLDRDVTTGHIRLFDSSGLIDNDVKI